MTKENKNYVKRTFEIEEELAHKLALYCVSEKIKQKDAINNILREFMDIKY